MQLFPVASNKRSDKRQERKSTVSSYSTGFIQCKTLNFYANEVNSL